MRMGREGEEREQTAGVERERRVFFCPLSSALSALRSLHLASSCGRSAGRARASHADCRTLHWASHRFPAFPPSSPSLCPRSDPIDPHPSPASLPAIDPLKTYLTLSRVSLAKNKSQCLFKLGHSHLGLALDSPFRVLASPQHLGVPQIKSPDDRRALSHLSCVVIYYINLLRDLIPLCMAKNTNAPLIYSFFFSLG